MGITRRQFIKGTAASLAVGAASSVMTPGSAFAKFPHIRNNKIARKAIVLGFDGMDPNLIRKFIAEGYLPTFKKVMEKGGHFGELQSTMPPQSPVAWASFINGTNPGGTGIYDFVHRDPASFSPYMSTTRSYDAEKTYQVGDWNIPLSGGRVDLMRKGIPFWNYLTEQDIPATICQIPSNFPIVESGARMISGMGTPDLLGSYGTCTLFSDQPYPGSDKFTGARVIRVRGSDNVFKTVLPGPQNSFRTDGRATTVELIVHRDAHEKVLRINVQGQDLVLRQGEWSSWVPLKFELIPHLASAPGMVRFYAQEIHPNFKLYVSPINIDPLDQALPISGPAEYASDLATAVGRFYTQGFPTDSKVLSTGIFSDDEYLEHAKIVLQESLSLFEYQLKNFHEGLFYFYFSTTDQTQHMLSRLMDPTHPLYVENGSPETKNAIRYFYQAMDDVLQQALSKVDSSTMLMALSDHGFAPFTREFNLSTWLVNEGFTSVYDPKDMESAEVYSCVDWEKTQAYALGINGLYINVKGREKNGSVAQEQVQAIKERIISKLSTVVDPLNNQPIITAAYDSQKIYSGDFAGSAPDLVIGYHRGYRISDEAVLGKFPKEIVTDRKDKWASDHCSDPMVVPGMILTNKTCTSKNPGLWDMGPSILKAFGIETPKKMNGKNVFD